MSHYFIFFGYFCVHSFPFLRFQQFSNKYWTQLHTLISLKLPLVHLPGLQRNTQSQTPTCSPSWVLSLLTLPLHPVALSASPKGKTVLQASSTVLYSCSLVWWIVQAVLAAATWKVMCFHPSSSSFWWGKAIIPTCLHISISHFPGLSENSLFHFYCFIFKVYLFILTESMHKQRRGRERIQAGSVLSAQSPMT